MNRDEEAEFEALIAKLGINAEAAGELRNFADKVADAAYERGKAVIEDIQSGRL